VRFIDILKWLWVVVICATVGTYVFLSLHYSTDASGLGLNSVEVIRVNGVLKLKIDRPLNETIVGSFFVQINHSVNDGITCTAVKSPDLFDIKPQPFVTRFLSRFTQQCFKLLQAGKYSVTVTYEYKRRIWAKSTAFTITDKDIDMEKIVRGMK
jgi:hypothetical protein